MKTFVLLALAVFSLVAAKSNLLKDAEPLLKTLEELPHFLENVKEELSLKVLLGKPEAEGLDLIEKKIKQLIGKYLREHFEKFLKKVESLEHQAEDSYQKLRELLKGKATAENAEKLLSELFALEDEKTMFVTVIGELFDGGDNLKEATLYSRNKRAIDLGIGDLLDKLFGWLSGLGSWIGDSLDVFKNWAKEIFLNTIDIGKPITDQIKILAMDFLQGNWEKMSVKLVEQALSFFHPYAGMLGGKVVAKLLELAKLKGLSPWTDVNVPTNLFLK